MLETVCRLMVCVPLLLFLLAILSSLYTLTRLRERDIPETPRVLWAALIVAVPFLDALAFPIVQPEMAENAERNDG